VSALTVLLLVGALASGAPAHAAPLSGHHPHPGTRGHAPGHAHALTTRRPRNHPAARQSPCPTRGYRVVCVDLDHQLLWVQAGRGIVYAPVRVRTGRAGDRTRTGWFRIYRRDQHHWSSIYGTPMPFSQFFSRGEAFHAVHGPLSWGPGSYGCVNLTLHDAARLWKTVNKGTAVYIWGRKPRT
jgi:lipoprotein-anchoring transpeptidase ErfK/SrfK